ncbi:glycosyltransferase [Bacteroides sp.]|uniref:glycosyltransferase family 4 protein n=1 Tax=Bacteroides sp. TaxID=29523 RepID=UPI00262C2863|nr:glycosyltransferase [Bacteroides sp.]
MNEITLNIVYVGNHNFPFGNATTKRIRYQIDYLNAQHISCHKLISGIRATGEQKDKQLPFGIYGFCDYVDITPIAEQKGLRAFWKIGKDQLKKWYDPNAKNVMIMGILLKPAEYPFYRYARKLGYKIVFDQTETSLFHSSHNMPFRHRMNIYISEWLSKRAYAQTSSFVISKNLWHENKERCPYIKLCLLPNSTPIICEKPKLTLNYPLKVLYSGTYGEKEGVSYLINGIIQARESGCPCELYLLGKGSQRDMEILKMADSKPYIHYLGFVSDEELLRLMKESDVLCMVRTNTRFANYGFPFKLSEYLATGNIVLATNVGDVCDYIENQKNAYIIKPESSQAIANALLHIQQNQSEAIQIAAGGLEIMKKYFSIEKVGKQFVDFLKLI